METERLAGDETGIARAAQILRAGGRVAFPTETVYGLGADAGSDAAVAGIFAAKDRPRFNPLIVHVPDLATAAALAEIDGDAGRLAQAFWPGPLTILAPRRRGAMLSPLVTAGLPDVALRVPGGPLARALLRAAGCPVAAPSANPSGRVSPTSAAHVLSGLQGRIEAVLDGGPCAVGVESTIVSCGAEGCRLLRPGGLPAEAIEACLDAPLPVRSDPAESHGDRPDAPGQLVSHYAPRGRVRLNVTAPDAGEIWLGFGPYGRERSLSRQGDLTEAAATLFRELQALDAEGADRIAVAPIPEHGLGRAINDRLRRAAAPR